MTLARLSMLLLVVVLMAAGQILIKLAARDFEGASLASAITKGVTSVPLVIGILVYGFTAILWVLVLRDNDLSRAYPFLALTLILVPLAGVIFFGETISLSLLTGGALIVAGVIVISVGSA
jgi:drug/metabolite transporter (DMT)-like permease